MTNGFFGDTFRLQNLVPSNLMEDPNDPKEKEYNNALNALNKRKSELADQGKSEVGDPEFEKLFKAHEKALEKYHSK